MAGAAVPIAVSVLVQAIPEPVLIDNADIDEAGLTEEDRQHRDTMGANCPPQVKAVRCNKEANDYLYDIWLKGERNGQHAKPEVACGQMADHMVGGRYVFGHCSTTSDGSPNPTKSFDQIKGIFGGFLKKKRKRARLGAGDNLISFIGELGVGCGTKSWPKLQRAGYVELQSFLDLRTGEDAAGTAAYDEDQLAILAEPPYSLKRETVVKWIEKVRTKMQPL